MPQRTQRVQGVPLAARTVDPSGGHYWYPPLLSDAVNVVLGEGSGEQELVSVIGNWSDYEVFCRLPNTWLGVELILRVTYADIQIDLDITTPASMQHMTVRNDPTAAGIVARAGAGQLSGMLFSEHGRPGYGKLSLVARRTEGSGVLVGGQFRMRAWGTQGAAAGDRVGRPKVDVWTGRDQFVAFATDDIDTDGIDDAIGGFTGPTFVGTFGPGGTPRTVHITDLSIMSDNTQPTALILQQIEPTSATVETYAQFQVAQGSVVQMNYAIPLTGKRGWNWRILRGAGPVGALLPAQMNGYVA